MTLTEILFSGKGESISYAIDGVDYAIDLEDGRATEFRDTLDHCIAGWWRCAPFIPWPHPRRDWNPSARPTDPALHAWGSVTTERRQLRLVVVDDAASFGCHECVRTGLRISTSSVGRAMLVPRFGVVASVRVT
ncbi:hypothetical protein CJ179_34745 [Rhodococcus sp. ACS1]|nr:hypothetical protein CJ179_34745 [Rhodococcus sp. ACS1]